jgi:hypothetical protein
MVQLPQRRLYSATWHLHHSFATHYYAIEPHPNTALAALVYEPDPFDDWRVVACHAQLSVKLGLPLISMPAKVRFRTRLFVADILAGH